MSESPFDLGPDITIAGTEIAQRNFECMRAHTTAEWTGDLDATMATMTSDPFQVFHATGLAVYGYDAVRAFYQERFQTFSGQGLYAHRMVVTDTLLVTEGYYQGSPRGMFFGVMTHGKPLFLPMSVWVYFEDTLIKGESGYLDLNELQRQIREGQDGDVRTPLVKGLRPR
ncbi:MAG: ester cyclase [Burkholderiales bacterium]